MSGTMHFILEIAMFVLACGMILAFIRALSDDFLEKDSLRIVLWQLT